MTIGKTLVAAGSGKPLATMITDIVGRLEQAVTPLTIADAMTLAGITNENDRVLAERVLLPMLKPGGDHYRLTEQKKWLRDPAKARWAKDLVDEGKPSVAYERETTATNALLQRVESMNGSVTTASRNAATNVAHTLANRFGRKLDTATEQLLLEDVAAMVTENADLAREISFHRGYQEREDKRMGMIERLMERVLDDRSAGNAIKTAG